MSSKLIIPMLSVGHGGMIAGEYQTSGKQHTYKNGKTIYEGEFNRDIKNRVCYLLHSNGYAYIDIAPEQRDVSRDTKVNRANKHHSEQRKKGNDTFLIEIHANAGGGTGCETFISTNASAKSNYLALLFERFFRINYPSERWRGIKDKNFDIVHKTLMAANLFEFFFMDNEKDYNHLMTNQGRQKAAYLVYSVIVAYIEGYE